MRENKRDPICAYCGVHVRDHYGVAPQEEHIIARQFFPDRFRAELPKVSSCPKCNQKHSSDEEYARLIMLTDSGCIRHPIAVEVRNGKHGIVGATPFSRSLLNNPSRRRLAVNGLKTEDVYSDGGVFLGRQDVRDPDWGRIEQVAVKIIRGLHYYRFKSVAPQSDAYIVRFGGPSSTQERMVWNAIERSVSHDWADQAFKYSLISLDNSFTKNAWLMTFYQSLKILVWDIDMKIGMNFPGDDN